MTVTQDRHDYSILIADDDRDSRDALRDIMQPEGFELYLASSGEEAIDIVQHQDVHLALMDMHLPKLTGLETMQIVQQIKGLLPTILISADHDDNLLRKALSAHAFCVLAKPVSRNVVIYVVSRAIEKFY